MNPHTPAETIENVLDLVDHVLVMTVNPGFGGQARPKTLERYRDNFFEREKMLTTQYFLSTIGVETQLKAGLEMVPKSGASKS